MTDDEMIEAMCADGERAWAMTATWGRSSAPAPCSPALEEKMSNYRAHAYDPDTGTIREANWLDNAFGRYRYGVRFDGSEKLWKKNEVDLAAASTALAARDARIAELESEAAEARRRRDEWQKKAEGYDAVRQALREKVGAPWPPHLSRALWAGIAADERKRADDAEARIAELEAALRRIGMPGKSITYCRDGHEEAVLIARAVMGGK